MFWHMNTLWTTLPVSIELVILFLSFFLLTWCITLMIVYVEPFLHPRDKSHIPLPSLSVQFSSVTQSCPSLCDPMDCSKPGLPVHHQLLEFTQTHVHWVNDGIQPFVFCIPFSSCLQSFPAAGSFPMSQFFTSGGQSIRASASASVLPMNIQDWFPLRLMGLISLQSKGLSRPSPTP